MKIYQHKQRGTLILAATIGLALVFSGLGLFAVRSMFIAVPLLLLIAWLFSSLTIEIVNDELRWRFGPGLINGRVELGEILSTQVVRTHLLEGWGIHLSRYGWLYNVSGYGAVAVTLRSGKRFALGTDEPATLARVLTSAAA